MSTVKQEVRILSNGNENGSRGKSQKSRCNDLDERSDLRGRERELVEEFENCSESDIARRFALLLRCVTDSVFDDILILSIEDFALPEGHDGKDDEDNPNGNNQHSHDGVPDEETVQVENVTKSTDSGDPTDYKKY